MSGWTKGRPIGPSISYLASPVVTPRRRSSPSRVLGPTAWALIGFVAGAAATALVAGVIV